MSTVALVIGGYVNGYSIVRELHEMGVADIALFDYFPSLSSRSRWVRHVDAIDQSPESLLAALERLRQRWDRVVVFPTADMQLVALAKIADRIADFCFLPFNVANVESALDKAVQYAACDRIGVPRPATLVISSEAEVEHLSNQQPPFLLKPGIRLKPRGPVFRNRLVTTSEQIGPAMDAVRTAVQAGAQVLCSEWIPGEGSAIYCYAAYRAKDGRILNEWGGRKLSQYPNDRGVFSSASAEVPDAVMDQGRRLIAELDATGYCEPEFKYDARDGSYKLMEVNLRSMMWNRVGTLSGTYLHYTQWLDATGQPVPSFPQRRQVDFHFAYMKHELVNVLTRRGYWATFRRNIINAPRLELAVWHRNDPLPAAFDIIYGLWKIVKGAPET